MHDDDGEDGGERAPTSSVCSQSHAWSDRASICKSTSAVKITTQEIRGGKPKVD